MPAGNFPGIFSPATRFPCSSSFFLLALLKNNLLVVQISLRVDEAMVFSCKNHSVYDIFYVSWFVSSDFS
jgi:hypothetical protein